MSPRVGLVWVLVAVVSLASSASGQAVPYNPYADSQDHIPPVAPDGTIHWGVFYKSAAIQRAYERLWNRGACRGTNQRITIPVASNKLVVDTLPEAEFSGVVRGTAGTLAGGIVAFADDPAAGPDEPPLVAQLHPAGVSRLVVTGESAATILRPGMTVRLTATFDSRGQAADPVTRFEIISPQPREAPPAAGAAGEAETVVGIVTQVRRGQVGLKTTGPRTRRLSVQLDADAVATIDAGMLELVSAGDTIEVKGRRWDGEGAMGAGTVFASDVIVRKPRREAAAAPQPAANAAAAR